MRLAGFLQGGEASGLCRRKRLFFRTRERRRRSQRPALGRGKHRRVCGREIPMHGFSRAEAPAPHKAQMRRTSAGEMSSARKMNTVGAGGQRDVRAES